MQTQLNKGLQRRVMYVESKGEPIEGAHGHIGWVAFSKSGQTVYYRDKALKKVRGGGIQGNFSDDATGDEFWISGIKKDGKDAHWASSTKVVVDEDAKEEYHRLLAE